MATQTRRAAREAAAHERSIDERWLAFAGAFLMMAGALNLIWGITALTKDDWTTTSPRAGSSSRRSTPGAGSRS
jgi:hypothetical protein